MFIHLLSTDCGRTGSASCAAGRFLLRGTMPAMSETRNAPGPDLNATVSCATCAASCCRQEVMLMAEDDIPESFTHRDAWGGWVMHRLDDGWCAALDRDTMRCTIYGRRPVVCREFPVGESDCLAAREPRLPAA